MPRTKYEQIVYEELVELEAILDVSPVAHRAKVLVALLVAIQTRTQGHFVYTNQLIDVIHELIPTLSS